MKRYSKKALLVNTFGTLGYISSLFLWGWTGIIYLPLLLANERIESFLIPAPSDEVLPSAASPEMSPMIAIFALVVTVAVLLITIIMLLRAPIAIAKTGKNVTTKAADKAVPLITKGRKLPKGEERRLTARFIKLAKLTLVLVPVMIGFIGAFISLPLPFELAILVSSSLAIIALLWFSLQYISARILSISSEQLV